MNRVYAIGNVTKDIELKKTSTDKSVVDFALACRDGKVTEFINCQAWEKSADAIAQFVSKGQKLAVEGSLRTTSYEGRTGKVTKTYVLVNNFEFCGPKVETNSTPTEPKHDTYVEVKSDDLPFY